MPAATLNFTSTNTDSNGNLVPNHAEQGATFTRVFTLHQGSLTDPLVDMASVTSIQMQVRAKAGSALIVEASTTNGRITIGSPTTLGQFTITIPKSVMATIPATSSSHPYLYDIRLTFSGGTVLRYFEGQFEVKAAITTDG